MAFAHRVLSFCILPLVAFIIYQSSSTALFGSLQTAVQPYLLQLPFGVPHTEPLVPRSSTPLIISATPEWSHVEKIASVAVALAELGYPITFIAVRRFAAQISALHINIQFSPMRGPDDKYVTSRHLECAFGRSRSGSAARIRYLAC
jgi:hypothetical protein